MLTRTMDVLNGVVGVVRSGITC